jgi:hypothetical protein
LVGAVGIEPTKGTSFGVSIRYGVESLHPSFVPQRDYRIDAHCAPRGDIAGHQRNEGK